MKVFNTNWDAKWLDELNETVPRYIKDIEFEAWQTMLSVADSSGTTYQVPGSKLIRIIVHDDTKDCFIYRLKNGGHLDETFPLKLRSFIREQLNILL